MVSRRNMRYVYRIQIKHLQHVHHNKDRVSMPQHLHNHSNHRRRKFPFYIYDYDGQIA